MNFLNIQIDPILKETKLELFNQFDQEQKKMNNIINDLKQFAETHSNDSLTILFDTRPNQTITELNGLFSNFWFRFVICFKESKFYFVLSENTSGTENLNHESLHAFSQLLTTIYQDINVLHLVEEVQNFIKLARKVRNEINTIINSDDNQKFEYISKYLQKNFLIKNNSTNFNNEYMINFSFTKNLKSKKFLNYGTKQLFTLNVPKCSEKGFDCNIYTVEELTKEIYEKNSALFNLFQTSDKIFHITLFKSGIEKYYRLVFSPLCIHILYDKIKIIENIKNF